MRISIAVAVFVLAATSAHAANDLTQIAAMRGKCTHLLFAGHDGTQRCVGNVVNSVHRNGRVGFTFTVGDLAVITFSGMGTQQVKDNPNTASQPLDKVIFSLLGTGTPPNTIRAVGVCTYGNPYNGPSKVTCSTHTSSGVFEGSFVSDGQPPAMQNF